MIDDRKRVYKRLSEDDEEKSDLFFSDVISDEEISEKDKFVDYLPVYSLEAVATSFGKEEYVQRIGWKKFVNRKLNKYMFITKVVGKSREPTIKDGSYCIFRFERGDAYDVDLVDYHWT